MTIEILSILVNTESLTGTISRSVEIIITNGGNNYLWNVGGLPSTGDLQTILNDREAELLVAAVTSGVVANIPEIEVKRTPGSARAWFIANPNAKLIFSMTVAEVVTEITTLIDATFPTATAGNRTKWKLLLIAIALVIKILVKREKLDV